MLVPVSRRRRYRVNRVKILFQFDKTGAGGRRICGKNFLLLINTYQMRFSHERCNIIREYGAACNRAK